MEKRNPGLLQLVFLLLWTISLLVNMDHGSVPAATGAIMEDFSLSKLQLGLLGSLVYVGLILGSLLGGVAFSDWDSRIVLSLAALLTGVSLIVFPLSGSFAALVYFSRLLDGFSQIFGVIYCPVWVDLFAPEKWKTLWLTFLQLSVPLGVILGYAFTALLQTFEISVSFT